MAQNSALTKRDNGDGTITITDTINGTSDRYSKEDWDNATPQNPIEGKELGKDPKKNPGQIDGIGFGRRKS